MDAFKAEAAIPTIKGDKHVKGIRVDSKFKVTGPNALLKPTMKAVIVASLLWMNFPKSLLPR